MNAPSQSHQDVRHPFILPGRAWWKYVLLVGLTVIAYFPALNAKFIWDDADYVTQNVNLHDAGGLARIWTDPHANWQYYPLVFTTFWAEYHAWGLNPFGYHLDNILLQALGAILLWQLLVKLEIPAAWLAAAIFAVHPVQVESVAWITERKNILCGVYYFAAMLAYFNASPPNLRSRGRASYAGAFVAFTCAMLSKTVAATWPGAVLVILWWKKGKIRQWDIWPLVPFLVLGVLLAVLTGQLESQQVGAIGRYWELSPADRIIVAGRALWFYAAKVILPLKLTFIYPKWDLQRYRMAQGVFAIAALSVIVIFIALRNRIGRGPAAVALLFAGVVSPALGFVNVYPMRYSFVADHFQYLAIVALIVPMALLARRWLCPVGWIVLVPLIILTYRQCEIYRDSLALWTDTVAKNPSSWMAHANLGQAYQALGNGAAAEDQYVEATSLEPDEVETWWKLGAFQADGGRYVEAEANFRRALAVDPTYAWAKEDLDKVLKFRGQESRPADK